MPQPTFVVIKGWTIFAHPLFIDELDKLITQLSNNKLKDQNTYKTKNSYKILAAIYKLAFDVIPTDPAHKDYRQAETLGQEHKHWFRAKFFQQYRLFFRFESTAKIIVYAWVNNEKNKRAYESKNDAYRTFEKMLKKGHPPDDFDVLLKESKAVQKKINLMLNKISSI